MPCKALVRCQPAFQQGPPQKPCGREYGEETLRDNVSNVSEMLVGRFMGSDKFSALASLGGSQISASAGISGHFNNFLGKEKPFSRPCGWLCSG